MIMKEYSYTSTPPMGRTACTEPFFLLIAPKILQVHIGLQIVPTANLQQCHFAYSCKCVKHVKLSAVKISSSIKKNTAVVGRGLQ